MNWKVAGKTLAPLEHVKMQAAAQKWVDSSISKTINCPEDISFEAFKDVYMEAWDTGCKGCTTYRPNEVTGSVLSVAPEPAKDEAPPPGTIAARIEAAAHAKDIHEIPDLEEVELLLSDAAGRKVAYWHDTGHAEVLSKLGVTASPAWLERFGSRTAGVHLHDVLGPVDHLPPGGGEVDWAGVAHYLATGKRDLLDVCIKSADLVCETFREGGLTGIEPPYPAFRNDAGTYDLKIPGSVCSSTPAVLPAGDGRYAGP